MTLHFCSRGSRWLSLASHRPGHRVALMAASCLPSQGETQKYSCSLGRELSKRGRKRNDCLVEKAMEARTTQNWSILLHNCCRGIKTIDIPTVSVMSWGKAFHLMPGILVHNKMYHINETDFLHLEKRRGIIYFRCKLSPLVHKMLSLFRNYRKEEMSKQKIKKRQFKCITKS